VNDFAGVIDGDSIKKLNDLCLQLNQKTQTKIAVVTIHSLDGANLEEYATQLFNQWGVGHKSTNRGVLILLSIQDRRYRIEVGKGLDTVISNEKTADIGLQAVPLLKQSQYGAAIELMIRRIAETITSDSKDALQEALKH
jgi:uncharacterized protein